MSTLRQLLRLGEERLTAAGVPDARFDAGGLLAFATGLSRMELPLRGGEECSREDEFLELLSRREQRIPLQYVLGEQDFYGLSFQVDERVLIPRPETELLCEKALALLEGRDSPRVLDLCTGSGAIATVIRHECPTAQVTATDLSPEALTLARRNAERAGCWITFLQGDLWECLQGLSFDLILSNPPYIPSRECDTLQQEVLAEPRLALDGGEDGLSFYRRIARGAPEHLLPGGCLMVEIGFSQGEEVSALFREAGLTEVQVFQDLSGLDRMVTGRISQR